MKNTKRARNACLVTEMALRICLSILTALALLVDCTLTSTLAFVVSLTTLALRAIDWIRPMGFSAFPHFAKRS